VHRFGAGSWEGVGERLFTFAFKGLVYPQIWEDPDVDLKALRLAPGGRVVAIASGGCNVLSYLTADPASIVAVDLNRAHVALTRLKLTAAQHLPTWDVFYRFFGAADEKANIAAYQRFLRDKIDPETRRYWEGRGGLFRRKRVTLFSRDLYRHGLLGYFIGAAHLVARLYGADPKAMMAAKSLDEQRSFYETALAPLFDKRMVRWATSKRLSLYGLGIPPAQYEALASAGDGDISLVLKQRLERLACGLLIADNYFAWQAFGRSYAPELSGPLPPYLRREHFDAIRARAERVEVVNRSFTEVLADRPRESTDAYVLLDAQDWMTDAQLNALWSEITRTAAPGAHVVFRTAAEPSLLPGRVDDAVLARWTYAEDESRALTAEDRSAIYGGFHLYVFKG
jgi:S-adenosylmethionine-diacylglycerol 3-amino-3-carboxypropyl transferase